MMYLIVIDAFVPWEIEARATYFSQEIYMEL